MTLPYTKYKIQNTKYFKVKRSFTLIELLIVITIIGILVATGTYSWGAAQIKARDNRRKIDLQAVEQALETYYQTNGKYPDAGTGGSCGINSCSSANTNWINGLVPAFLNALPKDP